MKGKLIILMEHMYFQESTRGMDLEGIFLPLTPTYQSTRTLCGVQKNMGNQSSSLERKWMTLKVFYLNVPKLLSSPEFQNYTLNLFELIKVNR